MIDAIIKFLKKVYFHEKTTEQDEIMSYKIAIVAAVASALADKVSTVKFTATVTDATGQPVYNVPVTFANDGGSISDTSVNTDLKGVAEVNVSSDAAKTITVTASTTDGSTASASAEFTAVPASTVDTASASTAGAGTDAAVKTTSSSTSLVGKMESELSALKSLIEHAVEELGEDAASEIESLWEKLRD